MTLEIATRNDMGSVTRLLTSHPEWAYHTHAGDNGSIVIEVENG
jgi:hypothetical protein